MPFFENNNGYDEINQEMIDAIEAQLAAMSPEERAAVLAVDDAMDRLAVIELAKRGINVELIPGDRHHIKVDGEKMGYAEFNTYMQTKNILDASLARISGEVSGDLPADEAEDALEDALTRVEDEYDVELEIDDDYTLYVNGEEAGQFSDDEIDILETGSADEIVDLLENIIENGNDNN